VIEMKQRKVEVFTAGCPLCEETIALVKQLSCPGCDVTIIDLRETGIEKAKEYGVNSVPTVIVDGKILECCTRGKPTAEDLKAAGIGIPL
jgi:glutaredoxin 3